MLATKTPTPTSLTEPPKEKTAPTRHAKAQATPNPVWSRLAWGIQPQLTGDAKDGPLERKADAAVERVMRQPNSADIKDAGGADKSGAPPAAMPLATFPFKDKSQAFGRFDATYTPVGPLPKEGQLVVELRVHITFENFSEKRRKQEPYKNYKFSKEQLKDFAWSQDEKDKFQKDFITSVHGAWSDKHRFHLVEPGFSEYRASLNVSVAVVDDPDKAHNKITALKIPKDAPRFRSFVTGSSSTLEIRDPRVPEKHKTEGNVLVRQIGPFGFDQSELTETLISQIAEVAAVIRTDNDPNKWDLGFEGRASSPGSVEYNKKLAHNRSEAVRLELFKQLGWDDALVANYLEINRGKEHATAEEKFRRVDVMVRTAGQLGKEVEQNTAAHEAGHMFGLGDEYVRETNLMQGEAAKFAGDKPAHYAVVQKYLGKTEADELLIDQSESIMSQGLEVKKGHYLSFLLALNQLTDKDPEQKLWKVE